MFNCGILHTEDDREQEVLSMRDGCAWFTTVVSDAQSNTRSY